jgi:hypothetical protein
VSNMKETLNKLIIFIFYEAHFFSEIWLWFQKWFQNVQSYIMRIEESKF